ncbi:MAG: hypothetical protein WCT08_01380 [Patescibacteria group bacterium]|jgi:hypothetical protein
MSPKVKYVLFTLAVIIIAAFFMIPGGEKPVAKGLNKVPSRTKVTTLSTLQTTSMNQPVILSLDIDQCSCSRYSTFNISWNPADSLLIDDSAMAELMLTADSTGLLLCDCSLDNGTKYISVVKEIWPLESRTGLRVDLRDEVYLIDADVTKNLAEALEAKKAEIFNGHDFKFD